ncbi:uncharacterized protein LOC135139118 isoform X2 [Zophobas morio]|uniref:uncharacterized protein LOC135139118 isoform X2 n=1 Tax=Zophobas morio TaxID=2755281 RepID=UPI00308298B6
MDTDTDMTDSSPDEEIQRLEQELKHKKEQRKRKKIEARNSGRLQARQPGDIPCSSKTTFKKRKGATDKGKKYEDLITANVVLQLVSDSKIKDFRISSNDENFGDFDDVVIEIETDSGTKIKALQLKHSNDKRQLNTNQLAGKQGDFSLIKYFKSAQKLQGQVQEYILFTPKTLTTSEETKFKLAGEEFYLKAIKKTVSVDNFDISRISENINYYHTFQIVEDEWTTKNPEKIQQYRTFFESFRLYTNQERFEALTKSTMNRFTDMFGSSEKTFKEYVDVISEWSLKDGKKEKLSKRMMQRAMVLRLLSSQIEPFVFGSVTNKMEILREAIFSFDITLLEKEGSNAVKKLWGDLDKNVNLEELNKVRSLYSLSLNYISSVKNLDANLLTQLLWLMEKCPLIVKEHDNIEKAIKLCPDAKFIILGKGKYGKWMKEIPVFLNLSDLRSKGELYDEVLQNFTISLQGKEPLNLATAFQKNDEISKHVTVIKLLEMSEGSCYVGGQKETFPNLYVDRYLSVNIIDIKYLQRANQNTVIILNCEENSEQLKITQEHTLIDINDFFTSRDSKIFDTALFIQTKTECSDSDFQKIYSKTPTSKSIHYFKYLKNQNLEWVRSRGDVSELRNYKLHNHSKTQNQIWSLKLSKHYLHNQITGDASELRNNHLKSFSKNEKEFLSFGFSNNISLITGDPGMGKTELTKSLKNNCRSKYWTVIMNPQDINLLFKTLQNRESSNYLNRFESFIFNQKYPHFERLDQEFLKMCLKQKNVIYVWDALDEILSKNLDATSSLILLLSKEGFTQCVTARQHLKSFLENKFNVLSVSINQFNQREQEDYIRRRLADFSMSVDMKETIEKIKSTFAFTKHIDILGIPLQIFMLTEVFLHSKEKYEELFNNKFLLTELYGFFVDGKFKFFFESKVPANNDYWEEEYKKKKEEKLKHYEKLALGVIFSEEILKELKIDCSVDENLVSEDFGTVGIITGLQNGIPQFAHASFAEYFVALYISKHFEMIPADAFFDQRYNNVRFFFDMITGKISSAHIAVLYRNFNELMSYDDETTKCKDQGGRSALHLICSWGRRYPRLNVEEHDDVYIIDDYFYSVPEETKEYYNALLFLLDKCEISKEDELKYTPLAYARKSQSLRAELELLQSRQSQFQHSYSETDVINILFRSAQLGYDDAIEKVMPTDAGFCKKVANSRDVNFKTPLFIASGARHVKVGSSGGHGQTSLNGNVSYDRQKVIERLVKYGARINKANQQRETPLYAASSQGNEKIVECLVKHEAEIDRANENGETPLYVASFQGQDKTVECLVKNQAEIDRANKNGETPLYAASSQGHDKTVECLVTNGAEINRANKNGQTPLYAACSEGHEKTVECLMKYGAKINPTNKYENTLLYAACSKGHEKIVECLVKHGAEINRANENDWTPLHVASSQGHENIVECLVKCEAEINRADKYGYTPLYAASSEGHEKVVECLLKCGAEINRANKDGWTPLHVASFQGHEKIVKCLVKCEAEINRANKDGWTPLHAASSQGHEKIVECLVKCGAEINHICERGCTPLDVAVLEGRMQIVEYLMKHGAKTNGADGEGRTPLQAASGDGNEKNGRLSTGMRC